MPFCPLDDQNETLNSNEITFSASLLSAILPPFAQYPKVNEASLHCLDFVPSTKQYVVNSW